MTTRLPEPYPLQAEIVRHPARFKVVATGRRSGKTTLGVYRQCRVALDYPGTLCWWVAPINATTNIAWRKFKEWLGSAVVDKSETYKYLILGNGSEIWCKSADNPDNLRGEGVMDLTLDEAAHIKKLDYVWDAVLRYTLLDQGGSMIALSTPNRRNRFWQWFVRGRDDKHPDWMSWNFPTTANPHLPREEFDALLQETPPDSELYRQELLGEFLESSGAVFRKIDKAVTAPAGLKPDKTRRYVAGIDWGKARDFTVNCIMMADGDRGIVTFLDRFNKVDYTVQRDMIDNAWARWGVGYGLAETNAMGTPNLEMLQRDGLPVSGFTTTATSKRPLIEGLAQAFETERISIPDDPVLIGELEAYERGESPKTGATYYRAPEGMHDDTVIALALAWYALQRSSGLPEQDERRSIWDGLGGAQVDDDFSESRWKAWNK